MCNSPAPKPGSAPRVIIATRCSETSPKGTAASRAESPWAFRLVTCRAMAGGDDVPSQMSVAPLRTEHGTRLNGAAH